MREESLVTSIMKRNLMGGISTVYNIFISRNATGNIFRNVKEGATVYNREL